MLCKNEVLLRRGHHVHLASCSGMSQRVGEQDHNLFAPFLLPGSRSYTQAVWRKHCKYFHNKLDFPENTSSTITNTMQIFLQKSHSFQCEHIAGQGTPFIKSLLPASPIYIPASRLCAFLLVCPLASAWGGKGTQLRAPAWLHSVSRKAAGEFLALILSLEMLLCSARHDTPCIRGSSDFFPPLKWKLKTKG